MKTRTMAGLLLLVSLLTLGAQAQTAGNSSQNSGAADNSSALSAANNSTYIIGPEDTLHIAVWKEADLTATLPVRSDGKISMPLLNDIQASGLTPMQLADSITEKLKKYVTDPRVTVVV